MNSSKRNLLAELDAEFGKKPKEKKVKDPAFSTTRRNFTGTFSDVAHEANEAVKSWRANPGYRPIQRLTHIITEHCKNCSGSVEYVGNVFTVFYSKQMKSKVHSPELITHDELGFELPHAIDEHHHEVDFCVQCLRLSTHVTDLVDAAFINGESKQLSFGFQREIKNA